jgi:hypothetical protein
MAGYIISQLDKQTYSNSQFLTQSRRDKAQYNSPNRDPHPEPRRSHTARELTAISDFKHELDDPASESDFNAYIAEQEDGTEPGDTCVWKANKCWPSGTLQL